MIVGVHPARPEDRPGDHAIAYDLEAASADNLDSYEALYAYPPELRSAGAAQERCDHDHGEEDCGMPLVISEYGTWFGRQRHPVYFTCECRAG